MNEEGGVVGAKGQTDGGDVSSGAALGVYGVEKAGELSGQIVGFWVIDQRCVLRRGVENPTDVIAAMFVAPG